MQHVLRSRRSAGHTSRRSNMSDHTSKVAPGVHVHRNGDVKVDPAAAMGVNIAGAKIALTAQAIRRLYEISVKALGR